MTGPTGQAGRAPTFRSGGYRVNLQPGHTLNFIKLLVFILSLAAQHYEELGLATPLSV